jgi:hypothetical protein
MEKYFSITTNLSILCEYINPDLMRKRCVCEEKEAAKKERERRRVQIVFMKYIFNNNKR